MVFSCYFGVLLKKILLAFSYVLFNQILAAVFCSTLSYLYFFTKTPGGQDGHRS